jgi:hypothetical protein
MLIHQYPMQHALKLLHAQTTSQDALFGIPPATTGWLLLYIPLLGSFLQDATNYALYRLGRLPARQQRLYRSFRRLHWFEIAIVIGLIAGAFALKLHDDQDPDRAANFAAAMQRPTLSKDEIADLEHAVLSDKVPLLLQRRFATKLFNNQINFRSLGQTDREATLRVFGVLNAVSMHLNKAFQADKQLTDTWPMVEFYTKAHRKIERNKKSCNETIVSAGAEIYAVTAEHCAKDIWSGGKYAFDQESDVAVRYIPPSSYGELPGGAVYRPLPTLYAGNAFGRLIVLDGYGFDYVGNVVRKIYF